MSRGRKLIPVDDEVLERIVPIARRLSLSPTDLVNLVLSSISALVSRREDLLDAVMEIPVFVDAKRFRGIYIPIDTLIDAIEKLSGEEYSRFLERVRSFAMHISRLELLREIEVDKLRMFKHILSALAPFIAIDTASSDRGTRVILSLSYGAPCSKRVSELMTTVAGAILDSLGIAYEVEEVSHEFCMAVIEVRGG